MQRYILQRDKFKGNGTKWLTDGLFLDQSATDRNALYTLQPWDREKNGKHYPSIHKLYVECEDVSEYEFANKYFACYQHWLKLKECAFFKPAYESMKDELQQRLKAKAVKVMLDQMYAGEASQATLSYLANKGYLDKNAVGKPKRAGRKPKKAEVVSLVKDDLRRLQE